jgi:hypothetical protein
VNSTATEDANAISTGGSSAIKEPTLNKVYFFINFAIIISCGMHASTSLCVSALSSRRAAALLC